MGQQTERDVGNQNRKHRPPGVKERGVGVEQADQIGVLGIQVIDQPQHAPATRVQAETGHEQADHHRRDEQHHAALDPVGHNVGVGPAQHHVDQQDRCGDTQGPDRRQAQQNLEHDQAGHELPCQIKAQQQRKHRDQDANALGLVAVAEVLGDGTVAEAMSRGGDQAHGDQHAQIDAGRIQEGAPDGRQAPLVAEARAAHECRAAGGRGRKRERQKQWPVGVARGGKVVGVFDPPLGKKADG